MVASRTGCAHRSASAPGWEWCRVEDRCSRTYQTPSPCGPTCSVRRLTSCSSSSRGHRRGEEVGAHSAQEGDHPGPLTGGGVELKVVQEIDATAPLIAEPAVSRLSEHAVNVWEVPMRGVWSRVARVDHVSYAAAHIEAASCSAEALEFVGEQDLQAAVERGRPSGPVAILSQAVMSPRAISTRLSQSWDARINDYKW